MPNTEWLSYFRKCPKPGCDWEIIEGPDSGPYCQNHAGDPLAAFRAEPEGKTVWYVRRELDPSTVNG